MTSSDERSFNVAEDGSRVGVQAQNAYIASVTLPGDVQLTVGEDASPEARYQAGIANLRSGNPGAARRLIWDAMMHDRAGNDALFHWLVAMLSGRTRQHFSDEETKQIQGSRSLYAEAGDGPWTDGVRLIYRLFDSVAPLAAARGKRRPAEEDMSLLVKQVDNLGESQRDLVRPHLELFLTGPLKDETWQKELDRARSSQRSGGRPERAWKFFQPIPARVDLPAPRPAQIRTADRLAVRAGLCLVVVAAGYLGWELLWQGAFLGLLSYAAALAGGAVAAAADLDWRFLTERLRQKDELLRISEEPAASRPADEIASRVDTLFTRYFRRYEPDKAERERWAAAAAGVCKFHKDEMTRVCRGTVIPADAVAWFIRYEVRQMQKLWREGRLHDYRRELVPQPRTVAARWIGLAVLATAGIWSITALWAHLPAVAVALASAYGTWRYWRRVNLERRRYAADSREHNWRQKEADEEFRRWSEILEDRPRDAEMAAWLDRDRTVLLGEALKHFQLLRSQVPIHAFLELPGVAVKRRSQIQGGPWRYAAYRIHVFVLAEDGVRQVRARLDFTAGTITVRERTSYSYDSIVAVRFLQEPRRQTFELRLAAGDPITIHVRDAGPAEDHPDQDASDTEETHETARTEEDASLDVSSMAELLHMLEKIAGQGRNWLHGQDRMTA